MISRIDKFNMAMMGRLDQTGIMWARVGFVVLIVAASMSWGFGFDVSLKHAAFLACLTFAAAYGPDAAIRAWEKRHWGKCVAITLGAVLAIGIEFYSHAGYTAGLRGHNIETTAVQNVRYDQRQDEVKEGKASLILWEKRLAELEAANSGWITTVTADALRAQLASANLAIEQEAARGGCKAKCLARTKERDELGARIALAEEKDSLTKKIEATKAVLARARNVAAETEHKSSPVVHQNQFLARAVTLVGFGSLEPSPKIEAAAQQSANLAMAIAGTGLPAFCILIAGMYRREHDDLSASSLPLEHSAREIVPSTPLSPSPSTTIIRQTIGSAALKRWSLRDDVRRVLAA